MHIMHARVIILKLYQSTYFHSEATRLRQGYPVGVLLVRGVRARTMHSIYIYILCILDRSTTHSVCVLASSHDTLINEK